MSAELLTYEQVKERLRTGWALDFNTPRLEEAARELMRPIIEGMRGQEIIYKCRFDWLVRITSLEVDDHGFRATATPAQEPRDSLLSDFLDKPFQFGAKWHAMHMMGSAIGMAMIPDRFWPDPAVVSAMKAAAARAAGPNPPMTLVKDVWREMREILKKASAEE